MIWSLWPFPSCVVQCESGFAYFQSRNSTRMTRVSGSVLQPDLMVHGFHSNTVSLSSRWYLHSYSKAKYLKLPVLLSSLAFGTHFLSLSVKCTLYYSNRLLCQCWDRKETWKMRPQFPFSEGALTSKGLFVVFFKKKEWFNHLTVVPQDPLKIG